MNRPAILTQPAAHSPSQQNLALFRIYVAYRSLLSVVLLIMLVSPNTRQLVGSLNPTLYLAVALAYLATSVPLVGSLSTRLNQNQKMMFLVFLVDIAAITLLADTSGGMVSGLPVLLVITVAASAVLITNRTLATLIAALSVLALLIDTGAADYLRCARQQRPVSRGPAGRADFRRIADGPGHRQPPGPGRGTGPQPRQRPVQPAAPERTDRPAHGDRHSAGQPRWPGAGDEQGLDQPAGAGAAGGGGAGTSAGGLQLRAGLPVRALEEFRPAPRQALQRDGGLAPGDRPLPGTAAQLPAARRWCLSRTTRRSPSTPSP